MSKIREKLKGLDDSFPLQQYNKEQLWDDISKQIHKSQNARQLYLRYAAVAASLLILAIILIKPLYDVNDNVQYSYSEDTIYHSTDEVEKVKEMESEAIEFIKMSCVANRQVCESSEFKELRQELSLVDEEINQLNEMIDQYGEDELLIKSKIKIENHKSEITQKLVQILMA